MTANKHGAWTSEELEAFEKWEMPDLTGISLRSFSRDKISDDVVPSEEVVEEEILEPPTQEEIDQIKKDAYDAAYAEGKEQGLSEGLIQGREDGFLKGKAEGFEEGKLQGYAEGMEQGQREIDAALAQLNSLMAMLHEPIEQQAEELEQAIYMLTESLVRIITRCELSLKSDAVVELIRESLELLPRNSERIRVFVNPVDHSLATQQASSGLDQWNVYSDEGVSPGGCRVETINSFIDATVERRLEDLLEQVVLQRYSRAPSAPVGKG